MDSTSSAADSHQEPRDDGLVRLGALSDGVFAIAMTLMAFEVRVPASASHTLPGLLNALTGPFLAFFWSFFATAIFWQTNRRLLGACTRADAMLTALNLLLLGEITLIPVANHILVELHDISGVFGLYLGLYGLIGVTNAASFLYAVLIADVVRPRPGIGLTLAAALAHCLVPVSMTALGVLSVVPGYGFLPALMPAVFLARQAVRRLGTTFDHWRTRRALPSATASRQVGAGSG